MSSLDEQLRDLGTFRDLVYVFSENELVLDAEPLGRGNSGAVFSASFGDRRVAVKVLDGALKELSATEEIKVSIRFPHSIGPLARKANKRKTKQVNVLAAHGSSHISPIRGLVEWNGQLGIVMDLYDGSLAQLIEQEHPEGLPLARALPILLQVAEALKGLQGGIEHRILHHNLKPEAVLLDLETGDAFLSDFATASLLAVGDPRPGVQARGMTPAYAAPEQWENESVGTAADIWALALVALFALTGRPGLDPGAEETVADIMDRVCIRKQPPEARRKRPALPVSCLTLFASGLARRSAPETREAQPETPSLPQIGPCPSFRCPPRSVPRAPIWPPCSSPCCPSTPPRGPRRNRCTAG